MKPVRLALVALLVSLPSRVSAKPPEPDVILERVVDGRGNRVADIAIASLKTAEGRIRIRLVRGLSRQDLVLRHEARRGPEGRDVTVDEIRLGDGMPLRFESGATGGRVTASSPVSSFRYFDRDVGRRTVRCNLARLVEETDHFLLAAVADYVEQGLEDDGLAPEETAIFTLRAVEKRMPSASAPVRKKGPFPPDLPEGRELRAAALAALSEAPADARSPG